MGSRRDFDSRGNINQWENGLKTVHMLPFRNRNRILRPKETASVIWGNLLQESKDVGPT